MCKSTDGATRKSKKWGAGCLVCRKGLWYARYYSRIAEKQVMRGTGTRDIREAEAVLKKLVEADRAEAAGYENRAAQKAAKREAIKDAGENGPALSELIEAWLAESTMSDKSKDVFRGLWRHLEAFAKSKMIGRAGRIDRAFAEAFYAHERQHYAPASAKTAVALPRWVWRWATERGILHGANPWTIHTDAALSKPHPTLTDEQVDKLLAVAKGDELLLVQLGINTGMRISDAAGLKWESVDLAGVPPRIHFVPVKTAKHHSREVEIPLLDRNFVNALKARRAATPKAEGYVFPALQATNRPFNVIRSIFDRAGVEGSFHSLRHTFVTRLRERGVSLEVIAAMTGHSQASMTARYGGVTERAKLDALNRLADVADVAIHEEETPYTAESDAEREALIKDITAIATTEQLRAIVAKLKSDKSDKSEEN